MPKLNKIVVVPSDPLDVYVRAGHDWLERYYNPANVSREVYCVSPYETGEFQAFGMKVIGTNGKDFRSIIQKIRPDVVRAYGAFFSAELVCQNKIKGTPTVVSIHDPTNITPMMVYADMAICMSEAVAQNAIKLGVDSRRIRIMPNRVDRNIFRHIDDTQSIRQKFPDGKLILHVGRKDRAKNLESVIQSLTLLPDDYFCVFVGLGEAEQYIKLAEDCGVAHRTHWIDSVKNSELPNYFSACDCFCVPSRWEGFGIVFIEAAACETSIVTSDIAPMNEYLTHNENAYLVKNYESPEDVAAGIRKVCSDAAYRSTIGKNARQMTERFDLDRIDEMEAKLYAESLVMSPNPRSFGLKEQLFNYAQKKYNKVVKKLGRILGKS
ncbi:MAG: glycosyltransferase family 4 protein [Thermoguttaceae bacterium]